MPPLSKPIEKVPERGPEPSLLQYPKPVVLRESPTLLRAIKKALAVSPERPTPIRFPEPSFNGLNFQITPPPRVNYGLALENLDFSKLVIERPLLEMSALANILIATSL
jgi:hypothetical protein